MKTYHSEIAESIGNLPQNTKFTCRSAYAETNDELFIRKGVTQTIKDYSMSKIIKSGVKVTYTRGTFTWSKYVYSKKTIKRRK